MGIILVFLILNCLLMLYFFDLYLKYSSGSNVPTLPGETNILVAAEGNVMTIYDAFWHGLLLGSTTIGWITLFVFSASSARRIWTKRASLTTTFITMILCTIKGVIAHDIAGWILVGVFYTLPFILIGLYLHLKRGKSAPVSNLMVS